jgi:hypothetical protein
MSAILGELNMEPTDQANDSPTEPRDAGARFVSMTPNAWDPPNENVDPSNPVVWIKTGSYREAIEAIRARYERTLKETGGDHKEAKESVAAQKKRLRGIMWGGVFKARGNNHLHTYSGLLCADIDHLDAAEVVRVREMFKSDPHVFAGFASPTGTGIKLVFAVECDAAKHALNYAAVRAYVRKKCGLAVDESCKNVERLCFVSHDPDAFLNPNATALEPCALESTARNETALPIPPVAGVPADVAPPQPSALAPDILAMRRKVAQDIWGGIHWQSATEGYAGECPGWHLHTSASGKRDVRINVDGVPTGHCFHNSCRQVIEEHNCRFRVAVTQAESIPEAKLLSELVAPRADDPDELLKHRYLCRGGGMLLVGPTGIGKSSLSMQAMVLWALGRDFFGIAPARPLKSLLIQSENDHGDLAEMRDGVIAGLNLTAEEARIACDTVIVVREDEHAGMPFAAIVEALVKAHSPDVLWIDPALAYLGAEASSQRDVSAFLRNMINPLLRKYRCGCVIIHHTNKPASGKEKSEWNAGDFAYLGSGSIEWANWSRAVLAVRSIGSHSVFELRAAKRGARLQWVAEDGSSRIFAKLIAHGSEGGPIYWRMADASEAPEQPGAKQKRVHTVSDLMPHVPVDKPIPKESLRTAQASLSGASMC